MNANFIVKPVTGANSDPKALDLVLEQVLCQWTLQRKTETPTVQPMVTRSFPLSRITSRLPKAKDVQDVDVSFTTPTKYFQTAAHGTKAVSNAPSATEYLTPG